MVWRGNDRGKAYPAIRWLGILVICFIVSLFSQKASGQEKAQLFTLKQSIDLAIERNIELQVAREQITVAREQKKEARTGFLPKLSAEYGYRRPSETSSEAGGITIPQADQNQYRFTGTFEQPLFTGFATLSNYELAKLGLDVAAIQLVRTRLDIVIQVTEAYLGILQAKKLREVDEQSVRQLKEGVRVAENFYRVGISPKIDVLDAETRLGEAEVQLIRSTNNLRVAEARFNTILRQPINTRVEVEDILTPAAYDKTYEASQETAMKNRPELLEAEKNVNRAEMEITLAKSDYYPTVSFLANYFRRGDDPTVDGSEFVDRESWDVIAVANWTFFEWGKTRYATNQRRAQLRQAKETLEQVIDSVSLEVKTAFLTLQAAGEAIRVAEKSVESAEENFRISTERYREQVATATEVLDAQTRLTQAKTNYTNALVASRLARARLVRAMGLEEES